MAPEIARHAKGSAAILARAWQGAAHGLRVLVATVLPGKVEPEAPDVATGRVLWLFLGWALFVAVALAGFGAYMAARLDLSSPSQDVHALPAPRLQIDPAADYDRLVSLQTERLRRTEWVDRDKGILQIPVERAMAILVGRGPAAFAPLTSVAPPDDARTRAVGAATAAGASR
ncbi:hypothetical protein GCM10011390_28500 [Aureimonas endophytica]|uniref:Uncharacterized protein n=1 Tax=Aureimonas endophytica TaxID=2027858 RepID=A0A916ZQA4_9HYPH|nr:hypothetical protein [Aureimonas endophytica]GGE07762.1 hypothetical protein GCM10011390_28500 [Aureimonas endophytica]